MFQHPDWVEMDRGTLHEADAIHRFQQRTGRPLTEVAGLLQAAKESLQPIPETLLLLQDLASKEIPLYCLSNMPATTAVYLRERQSTDSWFYGNMGE
jgi:putative hydrolase of the HAD superfamily